MLATVAIALLVKYTVHCKSISMSLYCFFFHNCLLLPLVVNKDGYKSRKLSTNMHILHIQRDGKSENNGRLAERGRRRVEVSRDVMV